MATDAYDRWFENDVKEYGIQTLNKQELSEELFENDVKEYGIQTIPSTSPPPSFV